MSRDSGWAWSTYKEAEFYLDHYHEIYQLNSEAKSQPSPQVRELRTQMRPRFEAMKKKALEELPSYPDKSKYGKALRYFLENYAGLTLFLDEPDVPIDNNSQERLLRNHVNPREYFKNLVQDLHDGLDPQTPLEFKLAQPESAV